MTDHDALLAAIHARPDDDTPRLVFADYLDDAGEPARAAFIRRQIDNASRGDGRAYLALDLPASPARPVTLGVLARIKPWERVRPEHVSPVVAFRPAAGTRGGYARCVAWHRGFVAVVGCTERTWHQHHEYDAFRGSPIEAVCYHSASVRTPWCSVAAWGDKPAFFSSALQPGIHVAVREPGDTRNLNERAFPNVRRFLGACTSYLLLRLAIGQLALVPAEV